MSKEHRNFPSAYAPTEEKITEEYGSQVFKAVMENFGSYRNSVLKGKEEAREYARGKQSLQRYLDELDIEENSQYVNIGYKPTKILQKFEKVVVDDYQQLKEKLKVEALSQHIKTKKEKKKSDLKFNYEYKDFLQNMENEVGFSLVGEEGYPTDEEELDLLLSISPDEREEVLMNSIISKILEDNDIESKKRRFLSDMFQVAFGGYHVYKDRNGKIKIDFVPIENAIYGRSEEELFKTPYDGKTKLATIGEIRDMFDISAEKEEELYKLAFKNKGEYGNPYNLGTWQNSWKYSAVRPYDDFTVRLYHIYYKTLETIEYVSGETATGRKFFSLETGKNTKRKRTGSSHPMIALEGYFAGDADRPIVLQWGKATNMLREGEHLEYLHSPYVWFMPDNRGSMDTESSVQMVLEDIGMIDLMNLKIRYTLANHPPVGFAIDYEALMEVDLGEGELTPLDLQSIYQQTGRLYYRKVDSVGNLQSGGSPIQPINISIRDTILTYLEIRNDALNNIRDVLGVNQNRDGTANLSRVSNSIAQAQFSVSQTATYYMYRAYLKATQQMARLVGIHVVNELKFGKEDKGLLYYLGQDNMDFIKSRKELTATTYKYTLDPQMSQEDRDRLDTLVQQGLSSGELNIADSFLVLSLGDIKVAEKYLRYFSNKAKKEASEMEMQRLTAQAEAQGEMGIRVEEAKRETFVQQSSLQAQEWEIKGKNDKDVKAFELATNLIKAEQEGKPIPPQYVEFVNLVMTNYMLKQEKSLADTQREIEAEETEMMEQQAVESIQQAVANGSMTEDEAEIALQDLGIV